MSYHCKGSDKLVYLHIYDPNWPGYANLDGVKLFDLVHTLSRNSALD